MPERPKGADCKSAGIRLRRFKSFSRHELVLGSAEDQRIARFARSWTQTERRPRRGDAHKLRLCLSLGSKILDPRSGRPHSRVVLNSAGPCLLSSVAEHFHGKEGVPGSNPGGGSAAGPVGPAVVSHRSSVLRASMARSSAGPPCSQTKEYGLPTTDGCAPTKSGRFPRLQSGRWAA